MVVTHCLHFATNIILTRTLIALHGRDSLLAAAMGQDVKGTISALIPLIAIPLAFVQPWVVVALYVLLAGLWFVPDRRIETLLAEGEHRDERRVVEQG